MLPLLLACGGSTPDTAAPDTPPSIDLPAAACGAEHALLPATGMGELLAVAYDPDLSLTAQSVRGILASQGLAGLIDARFDVDLWRVRYRTQDRGLPTEATGLVALPRDAGDVPILLWLHPTVGFSDACAPSATGLEGAAFPILFASAGLAVAAPDYLGMNGWGAPSTQLHPYIVAEPTALASLDNVRALLALQEADGTRSRSRGDPGRLVHWGASEGGFAALWTDRYQRGYAPELTTLATLASVPPTDVVGLASYGAAAPGPTSAGLAGVLVGMGDWYGADLRDVLQPGPAEALPREVRASCSDFPTLEQAASLDALFTPAALAAATSRDWSALPDWGCRLRESSLAGSAIPRGHDAPVFIGTAERDDLVVAEPTRSDIPRLCAEGYDVTYQECAGLGHVEGAVAGLPTQWAWLQARLAGEPPEGTCVVSPPETCAGPE
jgi:hypothetical protein